MQKTKLALAPDKYSDIFTPQCFEANVFNITKYGTAWHTGVKNVNMTIKEIDDLIMLYDKLNKVLFIISQMKRPTRIILLSTLIDLLTKEEPK